MNFDTDDSIYSDEAIKSVQCRYIIPKFNHDLDDRGTSVHKRMNGINTLNCKFKEALKDETFTQSSPFKSTNVNSSNQQPSETIVQVPNVQKEDFVVHLANSRRRNNSRKSIEQFQEQQKQQYHSKRNQPILQTNIIQARKPKRQIFVTQIVNDHSELTSFPFPKPERLSRIINNDGRHSQREGSASTPRGILKSSSFEVIRIGSRPSMQSLNSPMRRPESKKVSFEFTSEQIRKLKNQQSDGRLRYSRLKTKFQK